MDIKQLVHIKRLSADRHDLELSQRLAERLELPQSDSAGQDTPFFLSYINDHLSLFESGQSTGTKPLSVDFLAGQSYYRFQHDRRIDQPLAKSVGVKRGVRPAVCDVTAGFGEDAFVLAALGCRVILVERSPLIWALLDDGIRRAASHPSIGPIFTERISLHLADSRDFLQTADIEAATIYLDPMYPGTGKSALNKRKMRVLRQLVGDDSDDVALFAQARQHQHCRVVVKRPLRAELLAGARPDFTISGKSCRFDVYLPIHL